MNGTELLSHLTTHAPGLGSAVRVERGVAVAGIEAEALHPLVAELRDAGFDLLEMITAVDRDEVLELIYLLQSTGLSASLFVRTNLPRDEAVIASLTDLYYAADWQEREVYDLFGVVFLGHPNLRRVLLPEDWVGHPLRKDYQDDRVIPRPDYI